MPISKIEQVLDDFVNYVPFGHLAWGERYCIQDIERIRSKNKNAVFEFSEESDSFIQALQEAGCDSLLTYLYKIHIQRSIILPQKCFDLLVKYMNNIESTDQPPWDPKDFDYKWLNKKMFALLENRLIPVKNRNGKDRDRVFAWQFQLLRQLNSNNSRHELNIFFLGTGSAPLFGGHKDIYEGGDLLCGQAIQKAFEANQPTIVVAGVGTVNMRETHPLLYLVDKEHCTEGAITETLTGSGIRTRLKIVMEEFYIPALLEAAKQNEFQTIFINIVGHSRGAITAFAMSDCIDKWMNQIKNLSLHLKNDLVKQIYAYQSCSSFSHEDIQNALNKIDNIKYIIRILAYDPVEGMSSVGNNYTSILSLNLFKSKIGVTYSQLPLTVAELKICLAESERRKWFRPSIPRVYPSTIVTIKPVIGAHSTLNGYLSNTNNEGPDAFFDGKCQEYISFIREASKASIDLRKTEDIEFLFQGNLPPFPYITLYHIYYANKGKGYINTKNRLLYLIKEFVQTNKGSEQFKNFFFKLCKLNWSESIHLDEYINRLDQINSLPDFLNVPQILKLTQWIMREYNQYNKILYQALTKDIYEIYLSPKNPEHRVFLNDWQMCMKKDTNDLFKKFNLNFTAPKDNADLERKGWNYVRGKAYEISIEKYFYTQEKQLVLNIWAPIMSLGGRKNNVFIDLCSFDITCFLNKDEIQELYNINQLDAIQSCFSSLNFYMSEECKVENLKEKYTQALKALIDQLNIIEFLPIRAKILAIFIMRNSFIYKINIEEIGDSIDGVQELFNMSRDFIIDYHLRTLIYLMRNNIYLDIVFLTQESQKLIKYLEKNYETYFNDSQLKLFQECKLSCDSNYNIIIKLFPKNYTKVRNYLKIAINYTRGYANTVNPMVPKFKERMLDFKSKLDQVRLTDTDLLQFLNNLSIEIDNFVNESINEISPQGLFKSKFQQSLINQKKIEIAQYRTGIQDITSSSFSNSEQQNYEKKIRAKITNYLNTMENYNQHLKKKSISYTGLFQSKIKNSSFDCIKNQLICFKNYLNDMSSKKDAQETENLRQLSQDIDIYMNEKIASIENQGRGRSDLQVLLEKQQFQEIQAGRALNLAVPQTIDLVTYSRS